MSQEELLNKCVLVHGDKYDYRNAIITTKGKSSFYCYKHGVFEQRVIDHLRGYGCNKCAIELRAEKMRKGTLNFIEEATIKHNGKYTYTKSKYKNNKIKLQVACPLHGDFLITPQDHLKGVGCAKCSYSGAASKRRSSTEKFIQNAIKVHGNIYDYTDVVYEKNNINVLIKCQKHGQFNQTPNSHLVGRGCPECAKITIGEKGRLPYSVFLDRAKVKHGDKYMYDKESYSCGTCKINITCMEHGVFSQTAVNHLKGTGCPKCNKPIGFLLRNFIGRYKDKLTILYLVEVSSESDCFLKIGITGKSTESRWISDKKKFDIKILKEVAGLPDAVWNMEQSILKKFAKYRYIPDKKLKGGNTECFLPSIRDSILTYMN